MIQFEANKSKFDDCVGFFKKDISSLRTGRAAPSLVEQIVIDAYGVKTPLLHLASISCPDAKTIMIQPWDRNLLKDIEKGLLASDLQITPVVDSTAVRLSMPSLNEENRKRLVKLLHEKAEHCRVSIRQLREKIRSDIAEQTEAGTVSEDEKFKVFKLLDETMQTYNSMVKQITDDKEKEILTL